MFYFLYLSAHGLISPTPCTPLKIWVFLLCFSVSMYMQGTFLHHYILCIHIVYSLPHTKKVHKLYFESENWGIESTWCIGASGTIIHMVWCMYVPQDNCPDSPRTLTKSGNVR